MQHMFKHLASTSESEIALAPERVLPHDTAPTLLFSPSPPPRAPRALCLAPPQRFFFPHTRASD